MKHKRKMHHLMLFTYLLVAFCLLGGWLVVRVLTDNFVMAASF